MDEAGGWPRGVSRLTMAASFLGVALLAVLLLGVLTFLSVRAILREDLRRRLGDVAILGAARIDPARHARIRGPKDESGVDYAELRALLRGVRDRVDGLRFVYTMRQEGGRLVFVLDAEELADERSHVGDVYETPSPEMLATFEPPYVVRVENRFSHDKWGAWLSGFAPIMRPDGTIEGIVGVDMSASHVIAYERRLSLTLAATAMAVCLVVLGVAFWMSRKVARPLLALEREMARIQRLDLSGECTVRTHIVEVASMRDTLNHMRHGLRSFRRYVPADLVSELIRLGKEAELEVERREVTIFFSDIAGFTSLAERMPPDELLRGLGVYLKGMTKVILDSGGTVDKFIGDGIMAFWGAPGAMKEHAARACLAAVECQRFLQGRPSSGGPPGNSLFPTRIGLNSGEVLVGNVGYEERLNYTVIGDAVNVASRLEQLNKSYGTRILVGESVVDPARDVVEMRRIDRVAVKGKLQGITVYEVLAEKGGLSSADLDAYRVFDRGLDLYFRRSFGEALEAFEDTLGRLPQDRPAQIWADRCRVCQLEPPPPDWDGVTILKEK